MTQNINETIMQLVIATSEALDAGKPLIALEQITEAHGLCNRFFADNPELGASVRHVYGNVLHNLGRHEQALDYYQQALEMRYQVYSDEPHLEVASSLHALGNAMNSSGEYEQALDYYQQALEMERQVCGDRPNPSVASSLYALGTVMDSLHKYKPAYDYYEQALEMRLQWYGDEPHLEVANSLHALGNTMNGLGEHEEARDYDQQALEMKYRLYGSEPHPEVAYSLYILGNTMISLDQNEEARDYHQQALEMKYRLYGNEPHPEVASSLHALGSVMHFLGQHEEALDCYQRVLEINGRTYEVQDVLPVYVHTTFLMNLAKTLFWLGQYTKGLEKLSTALEMHLRRQYLLSGTLSAQDMRRNNITWVTPLNNLLGHTLNHLSALPRTSILWFNFKGSAGALDTAMHALVARTTNLDLKALYEAWKQTTRRLVTLQDIVPTTSEQASARQQQVLKAQQQRQDAEERLRREAREVFELQDLKLEQVAAALELDETYLDYALLGNDAFAFTLRRGSDQHKVKLFWLGSVQVLEAQVRKLRPMLEPKDLPSLLNPLPLEGFRKVRGPAAQLYDALIRPLGLNADSPLIVSPDGALNFVPFDLLYNAETGRFLGQDHEVSSVANARDLVRLHRAHRREDGTAVESEEAHGAVLMGHPEYTPQVPDLEGYLKEHQEKDFRREVASRLEPDELLLEFGVQRTGHGEVLSVLAVRKNGATDLLAINKPLRYIVSRTPPRWALLTPEVLRQALSTPDASKTVYEYLLYGILDLVLESPDDETELPGVPIKHLTVLTTPAFPTLTFADLQPLPEVRLDQRFTVEQHPSLLAWRDTRTAGSRPATLHAGILGQAQGGGVMGALPPVEHGLASWDALGSTLSSGLLGEYRQLNRLELGPTQPTQTPLNDLPQTLPQVLEVARTLGALEPRVFVGAAASIRTLHSVLSAQAPKILHLTTHGEQLGLEQYKAASPEVQARLADPLQRSYLLFAGAGHADRTTWSGEGLLSALDLATLELRGTRLVVLAACESGLGDALTTEGVSGFSQAAFLAGARATLTTLWKVEVSETTRFMREFYTDWQAVGYARPAQVLTQLKRRWLEQGKAPYYWAAFTLNGR